MVMGTKKRQKASESDKPMKGGGFVEFLKEKKARDGKLNKLGEWFLAHGETGLYLRERDLKYVLR